MNNLLKIFELIIFGIDNYTKKIICTSLQNEAKIIYILSNILYLCLLNLLFIDILVLGEPLPLFVVIYSIFNVVYIFSKSFRYNIEADKYIIWLHRLNGIIKISSYLFGLGISIYCMNVFVHYNGHNSETVAVLAFLMGFVELTNVIAIISAYYYGILCDNEPIYKCIPDGYQRV